MASLVIVFYINLDQLYHQLVYGVLDSNMIIYYTGAAIPKYVILVYSTLVSSIETAAVDALLFDLWVMASASFI